MRKINGSVSNASSSSTICGMWWARVAFIQSSLLIWLESFCTEADTREVPKLLRLAKFLISRDFDRLFLCTELDLVIAAVESLLLITDCLIASVAACAAARREWRHSEGYEQSVQQSFWVLRALCALPIPWELSCFAVAFSRLQLSHASQPV